MRQRAMHIRTPITLVLAVAAAAALTLTVAAVTADERDTDPPRAVATDTSFARIVAAYVAPDEIVFEPADLLTGDAAADAATADGAEVMDFYVRDHPDRRTTLPVAGDVRVTVVDCTAACEEGAPGDYGSLTLDVEHSQLYRLTVDDGVVTAIDEVYLP